MDELTCPACGSPINFKSRFSVLTVCDYCQSVIAREQKQLTAQGKASVLADDFSVIQLGTRGRYQNSPFEIIGLIKATWEDGFWNEWHALEENGQSGWLLEAMGEYSYVRALPEPAPPIEPTQCRVGDSITLAQKTFRVMDIKAFECSAFYGELPFHIENGAQGLSIDLKSQDNHCAYIVQQDKNITYYLGQFHDIDSLKLTHLKDIEGWL